MHVLKRLKRHPNPQLEIIQSVMAIFINKTVIKMTLLCYVSPTQCPSLQIHLFQLIYMELLSEFCVEQFAIL